MEYLVLIRNWQNVDFLNLCGRSSFAGLNKPNKEHEQNWGRDYRSTDEDHQLNFLFKLRFGIWSSWRQLESFFRFCLVFFCTWPCLCLFFSFTPDRVELVHFCQVIWLVVHWANQHWDYFSHKLFALAAKLPSKWMKYFLKYLLDSISKHKPVALYTWDESYDLRCGWLAWVLVQRISTWSGRGHRHILNWFLWYSNVMRTILKTCSVNSVVASLEFLHLLSGHNVKKLSFIQALTCSIHPMRRCLGPYQQSRLKPRHG